MKLTKKDIIRGLKDSYTKNIKGWRLQKRDFSILSFILEQKFASLEMIYFAYFDKRKAQTDPLPNNFWTTRQRLGKLRKMGLIKTEKVPSSSKGLYLLTKLGRSVLATHSGRDSIREATKIDFSLYSHDFKVGMIRAFLINRKKVKAWYSEKILRATSIPVTKKGFRFNRELIPDAVFINSKDERVALELEVSRKGPQKIAAKIDLYEHFIERGLLDKVWLVYTRPSIGRIYRDVLRRHSEDFTLYRLDSYDRAVPNEGRKS